MKMLFLLLLGAASIGCTTPPANFSWGSVTVVDDIRDMPGYGHVWRSGNGYSARFQTPRNIYSQRRYYDERGGYTTTTTTQYDSWAPYRKKSQNNREKKRRR